MKFLCFGSKFDLFLECNILPYFEEFIHHLLEIATKQKTLENVHSQQKIILKKPNYFQQVSKDSAMLIFFKIARSPYDCG